MNNVKSNNSKKSKVSSKNSRSLTKTSSRSLTRTSKSLSKSNRDIPLNQKHQIISVKEFGDYNYDTRRKQWHQKAGHNEKQVVCSICRDDDNWATIQVNNGAHICYFCWVKKPTAETKKIIATAKKPTPNKSKNLVVKKQKPKTKKVVKTKKTTKTFEHYDYDPNAEVVEIRKFRDDNGVSFRNADDVQNYLTKKNTIDKTSRYGVSPAVFYDSSVDYKKPLNKIYVVKPYDEEYLKHAIVEIQKQAEDNSKNAIDEYNEVVIRSKLVTKRNIMAAKIDSLRILTKAILLEKNSKEINNENIRHKNYIENISEIREQRLEKNKLNLDKNIANINIKREILLKRIEDKRSKAQVKLERKAAINNLKIEQQKEKVRVLASGQDYHADADIKRQIREIRYNKNIPSKMELDYNEDNLASLIKKLRDIDPKNLSKEERDAVIKFLKLVDLYDKEQKYNELTSKYNEAIAEMEKKISKNMRKNKTKNKAKNKKEYVIVSYDNYKKVVNAKKETLTITMPVNKLQQEIKVKTKTIKVKAPSTVKKSLSSMDTSNALIKVKPRKMEFEKVDFLDNFYTRDIERTIAKFKRIVLNTLKSSDFTVSPYGKNAYKIDYTKYQLKYRKSWADFFRRDKNRELEAGRFDSLDYMDLDEFNRNSESNWFKNVFRRETNDYGEPVARGLKKLRRLMESLPSNPVILQNNDILQEERIDLIRAIEEIRKLEISNNLSQEQVDKALKDVNHILDVYDSITKADIKYYDNIKKSQLADAELNEKIELYERAMVKAYADVDFKYNDQVRRIEERYLRNIENAENESLLNIEYIYEQEQNILAKEEEQHLWNKANIYEANNKLANNQYKYQNKLIDTIADEIEHFNRKAPNPISLVELPAKINKLPVASDETLLLTLEKSNNKVLVKSESTQRSHEAVAKALNKSIPATIDTIYVLDKYRNVDDLKTRIAMLNEYAKSSYQAAIKYNELREKREIEEAYNNLQQKFAQVDKVFADVEKVKLASERLESLARERSWVQNHYEQLKAEKWKIYDKDEYYKEKIAKLKEKQEQKQQLLIQKEEEKYQKHKDRIMKRRNRYMDSHETIDEK